MILISKPLETVRFHYTSTSKCENEGNEERELERTSNTVVILCSMLEMLKSNIERKFADRSISLLIRLGKRGRIICFKIE